MRFEPVADSSTGSRYKAGGEFCIADQCGRYGLKHKNFSSAMAPKNLCEKLKQRKNDISLIVSIEIYLNLPLSWFPFALQEPYIHFCSQV